VRQVGREASRDLASHFEDLRHDLWPYLLETSRGNVILALEVSLHDQCISELGTGLSEEDIEARLRSNNSSSHSNVEKKKRSAKASGSITMESNGKTYPGFRLLSIPGLGPKAAASLIAFAADPKSFQQMTELMREITVVNPLYDPSKATDLPVSKLKIEPVMEPGLIQMRSLLAGKVLAFTGSLQSYSRSEAAKRCLAAGRPSLSNALIQTFQADRYRME
jgi:NAD-dependent DNA ligase